VKGKVLIILKSPLILNFDSKKNIDLHQNSQTRIN